MLIQRTIINPYRADQSELTPAGRRMSHVERSSLRRPEPWVRPRSSSGGTQNSRDPRGLLHPRGFVQGPCSAGPDPSHLPVRAFVVRQQPRASPLLAEELHSRFLKWPRDAAAANTRPAGIGQLQ